MGGRYNAAELHMLVSKRIEDQGTSRMSFILDTLLLKEEEEGKKLLLAGFKLTISWLVLPLKMNMVNLFRSENVLQYLQLYLWMSSMEKVQT